MPYLCSFKCIDIVFDIFDTERVPIGVTKNKYFVTPQRAMNIEIWMLKNNIDKIKTKEQLELLISNNLLGIY